MCLTEEVAQDIQFAMVEGSDLDERSWRVLAGYDEPDIAAYRFQEIPHRIAGNGRIVVDLAKMGKDEVFQSVLCHLSHNAHRLQVGKVSGVAFDPLFQMPVVGTIHQHVLIMVAFQDQGAAFF